MRDLLHFRCLSFIFFLLTALVVSKVHVPDNYLCGPLHPNLEKRSTLDRFRNNTAPLYFWHLQKSAGSAFCYMMRQEYRIYEKYIINEGPDCNCHRFGKDIVLDFRTWMETYHPKGYLYVAMEPSNSDFNTYPLKYHRDPVTQILLNESYGAQRDKAWTDMLHVLVIRHPLDMAISAFNYKFPGTNQSIKGTCTTNKLSADDCLRECFRIYENPNITSHRFFNGQQLNRIRTEILGNYTINTFTLTNSLADAKTLLRKFHLIVDLSLSSITVSLLTCVLGWDSVKHTVLDNVNIEHPTSGLFDGFRSDTLKQMKTYLQYEIKLYGNVNS